ncbi:MAG: hypothetical protein WC685_13410 [Methylobacter sp.]|jgi:hypothetical protein
MVIYLKHAVHGNKIAISEAEAQADIKNGWHEYDQNKKDDDVIVNQLKQRGRPRK